MSFLNNLCYYVLGKYVVLPQNTWLNKFEWNGKTSVWQWWFCRRLQTVVVEGTTVHRSTCVIIKIVRFPCAVGMPVCNWNVSSIIILLELRKYAGSIAAVWQQCRCHKWSLPSAVWVAFGITLLYEYLYCPFWTIRQKGIWIKY